MKVSLPGGKWLTGPAAAALAAVTAAVTVAALSGGASASTAAHRHPRPAVRTAHTGKPPKYAPVPFVQDFSRNTDFFCPAHHTPCDGNGQAGDFGTIDRVPSRFSNGGFGNYAPFTKALHGQWMAVVSGTGVVSQGQGCPGVTAGSNPGESCTGPYAYFGTGAAQGRENVFPAKGFTITNDLYLSPSTTAAAGSLADDDVALNNPAGTFRIDNIITACAERTSPSAPMGYVINFGNGSPGSCAGTPAITKDGWYRFVFVFSDVKGNAYLTESVRSEATGAVVATSGLKPVGGTPTPVSTWGGPRYFWLPSLDMSGLPLANFALQPGQVPAGHKA